MVNLQHQLQLEIDAAYLYERIAEIQADENLKSVLLALAGIEQYHAGRLLKKIQVDHPGFFLPKPSFRAKLQLKLGRLFGYDSIISSLSNMERAIANSSIKSKLKKGEKVTGFEHNHLNILETISKRKSVNISHSIMSKFEGRHKSVGGNAVRAAVLGANDGLVSNMSLVMGVAGASAENRTILITGIAGLLAGAISMALGEWLSVQSSRELYLRQIALETEELENSPEEEKRELILLYQAKGMSSDAATDLANKVFANKESALDALVVEELGIDQEELGGSAWEAAIVSFILFAAGAIIPVISYLLFTGDTALYFSLIFSVIGLFIIGAAITIFTGRSILFSGMRQMAFGLVAAAITYGIGAIIGTTLIG